MPSPVTDLLAADATSREIDDAAIAACIEACLRCHLACTVCASSCLAEPDVTSMSECIRDDLACAELCRTTASVLAISQGAADLAHEVAAACRRACEACAESCDAHADHHEHCRLCAEACRECADACAALRGNA